MEHHKDTTKDWIGTLVRQLDLVVKEPAADLSGFRAHLDECQISERIGQVVTYVNRGLGYQAIHHLDFQQPQRGVLRLTFSNRKAEYNMEVVIRSGGPAVVFHSSESSAAGVLEHYLHGYHRSAASRIAFNRQFEPAEVTEDTIRAWISFLLSGFNKKFEPGMETGSARMTAYS